jgi:hypothetical protein
VRVLVDEGDEQVVLARDEKDHQMSLRIGCFLSLDEES